MTLWIRVRRVYPTVLVSVATFAAVVLCGQRTIPLPDVLGAAQLAVPVVLLLPLAVAIALARGLNQGDPALERVASRPLLAFDLGYAVATAALCMALAAAVAHGENADLALASGRNGIGYVALTLIGRAVFGAQPAAVLPVAYGIAASLLGGAYGGVRWWAWPVAEADNMLAWCFALGLLAAGTALTVAGQSSLSAASRLRRMSLIRRYSRCGDSGSAMNPHRR